jgi:hypothetical protein
MAYLKQRGDSLTVLGPRLRVHRGPMSRARSFSAAFKQKYATTYCSVRKPNFQNNFSPASLLESCDFRFALNDLCYRRARAPHDRHPGGVNNVRAKASSTASVGCATPALRCARRTLPIMPRVSSVLGAAAALFESEISLAAFLTSAGFELALATSRASWTSAPDRESKFRTVSPFLGAAFIASRTRSTR